MFGRRQIQHLSYTAEASEARCIKKLVVEGACRPGAALGPSSIKLHPYEFAAALSITARDTALLANGDGGSPTSRRGWPGGMDYGEST
jgi:hypothetical protein